MAIKSLKTSISISETQKMIHRWKASGVTDSASLKLLDLYLGMPNFMNEEGIYPIRNLYQICLALKTIHTSDILEYIKKCKSFELIWNENETEILAFYTPLWHSKTDPSVSLAVSPTVSPAVSPTETKLKADNNILYNIYNNIYPPEDSPEGFPPEKTEENPAENSLAETPTETLAATPAEALAVTPAETPDGTPCGENSPGSSAAKDFFHCLNANPDEKKRILIPIIDSIALRQHYTRPRALDALVILVNEFLIPHFDSQPRFAKTSHVGRIIWLQNLIKSRHGDSLMQQAAEKLNRTLLKELEEQRKKCRDFRPLSPFEWKDAEKNVRYYDDPVDGKQEIPCDAPPRPGENAVWNILSEEWIVGDAK